MLLLQGAWLKFLLSGSGTKIRLPRSITKRKGKKKMGEKKQKKKKKRRKEKVCLSDQRNQGVSHSCEKGYNTSDLVDSRPRG